jgi:hypothetical protein
MKPEKIVCKLPKAPNVTTYKGKMIIFTAFYDYKGYAPYITSMIATAIFFERLGIEWDYWHIFGDFHFDRALNQAMTNFMRSDDFTDIILIDSDEKWGPEGILRLLSHDVEVVAGSYRMKNQWNEYTGIPSRTETGGYPGKVLKDGTALLQADRITGGFTRFTKGALQKFADAYPELHYADGMGSSVAFFHSMVENGLFYSHDYLLSDRWRAIGVDMWIDPNIDITHYGTVGYDGNLDKHLKQRKALQDSGIEIPADAIKVLRDARNTA